MADMIYIFTEQCMVFEWTRCTELLISWLLDDLPSYKIGAFEGQSEILFTEF